MNIWICLYLGSAISGLYSMYEYLLGLIFTQRDYNFYGLAIVLTILTLTKIYSSVLENKKKELQSKKRV